MSKKTDEEKTDKQVDKLKKKLNEQEALSQEYLGDLKRIKADFENYKKRIARMQQEFTSSASSELIKKLFPVLDDLQRAIASSGGNSTADSLCEGLDLVNEHFIKVLSDEGVELIDAEGKEFDPRLHEAAMRIPSEDVEEGHVAEVIRNGYILGDRVLRPAMVKVAVRTDEDMVGS